MGENDPTNTVESSSYEILKLTKPNFWNSYIEGNADRETEIEARKLLFSVADYTKEDLDNITIIDFYSLLEHIESKYKNG